MSNAWKQDMCGCCGDCTVCWYALCCGPCQVCDMATALQKSGCCYCLLGTIGLPCLPIFLLRAEARRRYDIAGSCCCDCLAAYFCTECVQCQLGVEIQEQARKQPGMMQPVMMQPVMQQPVMMQPVMQQPVMMGQQMPMMMPR